MSVIPLDQQKMLGRRLNRLRRNVAGNNSAASGKKTGLLGQMNMSRDVPFIILGSFAFLKDLFDFVFVGRLFFTSGWHTVSTVIDWTTDGIAGLLYIFGVTAWVGAIVQAVGAGASYMASLAGSAAEVQARIEGIVMPFTFEMMFMVGVIATLLVTGTKTKNMRSIFFSTRFLMTMFLGFIAEIIPFLNILPWATIYVVFLYFNVLRVRKNTSEGNEKGLQIPGNMSAADGYAEEQQMAA